MKITKSQLKKIIKEELNEITGIPDQYHYYQPRVNMKEMENAASAFERQYGIQIKIDVEKPGAKPGYRVTLPLNPEGPGSVGVTRDPFYDAAGDNFYYSLKELEWDLQLWQQHRVAGRPWWRRTEQQRLI